MDEEEVVVDQVHLFVVETITSIQVEVRSVMMEIRAMVMDVQVAVSSKMDL